MKCLLKFLPLLFAGCFIAAAATDADSDDTQQKTSKQQGSGNNVNQAMDSVLIVKSPDGSGSAFVANFGKENVIVTNAHVFLTMTSPEICDVKGRKYEITKVLGSKSRDLVFLSYTGGGGNVLTIEPDITRLPVGTPVIAYGNSLGDNVITAAEGVINGIGPETIEVDAGFVPGNSGGPILDKKSGKVVGVATYLRIVSPDVSMQGSRYNGYIFTPTVRRFAVRIDNVDPDDWQQIDPVKLNSDRKIFSIFIQKYKILSDNAKKRDFNYDRFVKDISGCCKAMGETEDYEWHSEYLKREYEEKSDVVRRLLEILNMTDLLNIHKIQKIWASHLGEVEIVKVKPFAVACFYCLGTGRKSNKYDNPNFSRQAGGQQTIIETKKCPVCRGDKKIIISGVTEVYKISPELEQKLSNYVFSGNQEFADFEIGGPKAKQLEIGGGYYQNPKNLVYSYSNPFGETMLFRGNHSATAAMSTELVFMFGRLVKVKMVFGGIFSESDANAMISKFYPKNLDLLKKENYTVEYELAGTADKIPLDNRGMPLISLNKAQQNGQTPHPNGDMGIFEDKDGSWGNKSDFAPMPKYESMNITAESKSLPAFLKLDK